MTVDKVEDGLKVISVYEGSPAARGGLRPGDVITNVDGKTVRSASDLTAAMFRYHPGDRVDLKWIDENGSTHSDSLTLVAGPPN
jgi:S1-C subfamily serine protease